jgi:hypothetical protein
MVIRSLGALQKPVVKLVSSVICSNSLDLPLEFPVASFDGAAKVDGSCSGAGGIIRGSTSTVYRWYLNFGKGTNTKVKYTIFDKSIISPQITDPGRFKGNYRLVKL